MTQSKDAERAKRLIGHLDLTELGDDCTPDDVENLLARARTVHGPVAAVCVWPRFVKQAVAGLRGSHVQIATVVNFPSGQAPVEDTLHEVRLALADGATEIDMVVDWRRGPSDAHAVTYAVRRVKDAVGGRPVKAILETGMLDDAEDMALLARAALAGEADFVKTSTGKAAKGASPEAAGALLGAIRQAGGGGLKVSGGVRSFADADAYATLAEEHFGPDWLTRDHFRIGASGVLADLLAVADGGSGPVAPGGGY